jgi:hypothetical protein
VEGSLLAVFSNNTRFASLQAAQETSNSWKSFGQVSPNPFATLVSSGTYLAWPDPQLTRPVQPGEAACSIDLEIRWSLPVINISLAPFCLSALLENRSFRPLIGPSINIQEILANK